MFRRPRQRRGPYALASTSPVSPGLVRISAFVLIAVLLFLAGRWTLRAMGVGNNLQRAVALLVVDDGAQASVALDGGGLTRTEDTLKLYAGDRVVSNSGRFSLLFFDGTLLRGDTGTDLTVRESARGTQTSTIDIRLARGSVWLRTPSTNAFTGTILRQLQAASLALTLPSGTEVIASDTSLAVFSSDGPGVSLSVNGSDAVTIGEGQEFTLPEGDDVSGDLYAYREPLTAQILNNPFLANSRTVGARAGKDVAAALPVPSAVASADILTITAPEDGAVMTARTIRVTGTVGEGVARVRVNGYQAGLDGERRTFTQELALPDSEEAEIHVEALDERGVTLAESRRIVRRDIQPPPPPAITQPAPQGSIYRTNAEKIEIRGTAPAGVAGILVNDYRLQLFKQGDTQWSYLGNTLLGNLVKGSNLITVVSVDEAGNQSEPVTVTILIEEEGEQGIIGTQSSSTGGASSSSIDISTLPDNAPLQPGSVRVTGPAEGTSYTMTGTELLLEGTSPANAASVWVNDYKLQLFNPSKLTWTYIAREEWGTLKIGSNEFVVIVRDAENKIIDRVTYTVEKI